jgi:hypothetical protein
MALRKRFKFGLIAVGGLLAVAGLAVALLVATGGHQSASRGTVPANRFSSAQQARLELGLTAPDIAAQSKVVAAEVRAQFVGRGRPLLPSGVLARGAEEIAKGNTLDGGTPYATAPGLLTGTASIGYTFLRASTPRIRSVLNPISSEPFSLILEWPGRRTDQCGKAASDAFRLPSGSCSARSRGQASRSRSQTTIHDNTGVDCR